GAANDPYGFKPTDLVVDYDGSLYVSDWADGQRPRRGRGRIYRIRYDGKDAAKTLPAMDYEKAALDKLVEQLDSDSEFARQRAQAAIEKRGKSGLAALEEALDNKRLGSVGRSRAAQVIANLGGAAATERLFALAKTDPTPRVQAQAIRALADLTDPVLVHHRLDAGPGDKEIAARLAARAAGREPEGLPET